MSDAGEQRAPTTLVIVASLVVLALATLLPGGDDADGEAAGVAPDAWDDRLAPYVDFVAEERGLEWEHPVEASFLDDASFRERVTSSEEPTEEEAAELEQLAGVFRALGLVEGDIDLRDAMDQAVAEGVLGFYDPDGDEIVVRGDEVTAASAPVIVHELTHALQAQHFDLQPDLELSGEVLAHRTVVEADANRIQQAYLASLSAAEQEAWFDAQVEQYEGQDLEGVPPFLTELLGFPYALGPPWLQSVIGERGVDAVDDLFEERPASEEHIALPAAFLDGDEVRHVPVPALGDGEEAFGESGDFGMVSLLLVLGERLPWREAWPAVQGWSGDASVTFRAGERDCIRVDVAMDDEDAARRLGGALRSWLDGRPHGAIELTDDVVRFESCDPGTGVSPAPSREEPRAFEILSLRAALAAALSSNTSPAVGECVADHLLLVDPGPARTLELASTTDPSSPAAAEVQGLVSAAFGTCT